MKKILFTILLLICVSSFSQTANEPGRIKLPLIITKITAHGQDKNTWTIQAEQIIDGVSKTKFYKVSSIVMINDKKYEIKNIDTDTIEEKINDKNGFIKRKVYCVVMQREGGLLIKAKEKDVIWDIEDPKPIDTIPQKVAETVIPENPLPPPELPKELPKELPRIQVDLNAKFTYNERNKVNDKFIRLVEIEGMSYNQGKDIEFPYTVKWTNYELPKSKEDKSACKDILVELKQINKALEMGINYTRFCDLVQQTILAVEKIKDKNEGLPEQFIKRVDTCLSWYNDSKKTWASEIKYPNTIAFYCLRTQQWAGAGIDMFYCIGVVENNTAINDLILVKKASDIFCNETMYKPNLKEKPHPYVSRMTNMELLVKFRQMADDSFEVQQ